MLVLLVAFGGPVLQRLESFSSSPLVSWRRSNWCGMALLVAAVLLALSGNSGGQGALILALLPVAWVLVTDRAIHQTKKPEESSELARASLSSNIRKNDSQTAQFALLHEKFMADSDIILGDAYDLILIRSGADGDRAFTITLEKVLLDSDGDPEDYEVIGSFGSDIKTFESAIQAYLNNGGTQQEINKLLGEGFSSKEESNERTNQASSSRDGSDAELPGAEELAQKVNAFLDEVINENIGDFEEDGSYKVRPDYGYGKFYLDSVDGSYDMSLQGLIHYIMYEEDIYEEFLSKGQLNAVQECIDEYPEAIYSVDTSEGNGQEVESLLDEIYSRCIEHVARRLNDAGLNVDAFGDFLSDDYENELSEVGSSGDLAKSIDTQPLSPAGSSQIAAKQQLTKALGIKNGNGPFATSVVESSISKPDDDGDISVDLKLSLSSYAEEDVELVFSKLVVLTASGLPLLEREDEHDMLISDGSSEEISLCSGYLKASQISDAPACDTQVFVQFTPCGCKFIELQEIEVASPGNIAGIPEAIELLQDVQLLGLSVLASKPDDDGDCQLEFKGLVVNESESVLNKVVVSIRILDKNGREIDSTEWSDKVAPSSMVCFDTSLWGVKASRLAAAKAHVSIKAFQCLGNQEISWSVGSRPKPIEAEVGAANSEQQALASPKASFSQSAYQAISLPPKDFKARNCNAFDLEITTATYQRPDDDGDTRYEAQYSVINRSNQAIELLTARLFVLHPSGLVVATTEDESEDMADNGESITASTSTWGTSVKELDGDPGSAQLMLQVTACVCSFQDLGSTACPSSGSTFTMKPKDQRDNDLVVEAITITAEPSDDGECCLRIKALIRNKTTSNIPRAVLSTKLISSSGRELEDTYTQEEIAANSQIVLEDSFWGIKENRINSSNLQFNLKAFAAAGVSSVITKNLSMEN